MWVGKLGSAGAFRPLTPGQLAFAEFFFKAQLVYINLQILYNSQKYFKLNLLAL